MTIRHLKLSELYIRICMFKKYERIINDSVVASLLDNHKLSYYRLLHKNVFLTNSIYNIYTLSYFTFYSTIDQSAFFTFEKCYNSLFKWLSKPYFYPIWYSSNWSDSYLYGKNIKTKKKKFKKKKLRRLGNKIAKLKINSTYKLGVNNFYRRSSVLATDRTKELGSFFETYTLYRLGNLQLSPSRNEYTKNFRKNKTFSRYYFNLKVHSLELFNLVYDKSKSRLGNNIELPSYLLDFFPDEDHSIVMADYSYFLLNLKKKVKNIQFLQKKKSYKLNRLNKLNFYLDKLFKFSNSDFLKKSITRLTKRSLLLKNKKLLKHQGWRIFKGRRPVRRYWTLAIFKKSSWRRSAYIAKVNTGQIMHTPIKVKKNKIGLLETLTIKTKERLMAGNLSNAAAKLQKAGVSTILYDGKVSSPSKKKKKTSSSVKKLNKDKQLVITSTKDLVYDINVSTSNTVMHESSNANTSSIIIPKVLNVNMNNIAKNITKSKLLIAGANSIVTPEVLNIGTNSIVTPEVLNIGTNSIVTPEVLNIGTNSIVTPEVLNIGTNSIVTPEVLNIGTNSIVTPEVLNIGTNSIVTPEVLNIGTNSIVTPEVLNIGTNSIVIPEVLNVDATDVIISEVPNVNTTSIIIFEVPNINATDIAIPEALNVNAGSIIVFDTPSANKNNAVTSIALDGSIDKNTEIKIFEVSVSNGNIVGVVPKKKKKKSKKKLKTVKIKILKIIKVARKHLRRSRKGQHYRWFGNINSPQIGDLKATIEKRKKFLAGIQDSLHQRDENVNLNAIGIENSKFDLLLATYINNIITSKSYLLGRKSKLKKKVLLLDFKIRVKKARIAKFKSRTFRKIRVYKKKFLIKNYKLNKYQNILYRYKNLFFLDKSKYFSKSKFFYKYNNLSMCIYFLKKFALAKSLNLTLSNNNIIILKPTKFFRYKLFENYNTLTNVLILQEPNSYYTYSRNSLIKTSKYSNQIIFIFFKFFKYANIKNSKFKINYNVSFLLHFLPNFFIRRAKYNTIDNLSSSLYKSNIIFPNSNFIKLVRRTRKKWKISQKKYLSSVKQSLYTGHLSRLLSSVIKSNAAIAFVNLKKKFKDLSKKKLARAFYKNNMRFHWRIGTGFFLKEAIYVTMLSITIRDPILFINWFCKIMSRLGIKKHKIYLYFFRSLFKFLKRGGFFKLIKLNGIYLDVRGKVGVTGDSKKRHFLLKYGHCSFSRKALNINPYYGLVNTKTGVLGITFILFYTRC